MKYKKLLFIAVAITSLNVSAASEPGGQIGILVPATPPCPEIDGEMDAALANADNQVVDFGEILAEEETPSKNGCLPSLENIGMLINGSVPNFSMSGILTKIKDAACSEMDKAISRSLDQYKVVAKAPYGLGHVKVGAGEAGDKDESWKTDNGKSVFDPITQEAIKLGTTAAREAVYGIEQELPSTDGINRTIKQETNDATDSYEDSVGSARDALNGM